MKAHVFAATLLVGWLLPVSAFARFGSTPEWVMSAASLPTPADVGSAPAVVLMREEFKQVRADGTGSVRRRTVIRILRTSGAKYASSIVYFTHKADEVDQAEAWLIRGGKEVDHHGAADWPEGSSDAVGALHTDAKWKSVGFDAVADDVFASETEITGSMLVADDLYMWGAGGIPVRSEKYRLRLPPHFVLSTTLRGSPAPTVTTAPNGLETTWSLENLPYVAPEPESPTLDPAQPLLLLRFHPEGKEPFRSIVLNQWTDLGGWLQNLNCHQSDTSPALLETTQRLTAGCTTPLAKIRALCNYVQKLRYAALFEGLARGYGYQPHKASIVFGHGYGDCKDKANLLCTMLKQVGIQAHIAAAHAGDDFAVEPAFPSAAQFNHAICAIQVDDSVQLPSVVQTAHWGRVLFFDATSEHTCVGDLPSGLQGTYVFVQEPESDSLIQLPRIAPAQGHRVERKVDLKIAKSGAYSGHVTIKARGQAGAYFRAVWFESRNADDLNKLAAGTLGDAVRSSRIENIKKSDDTENDITTVDFDFAGTSYLQFFPNALAAAKSEVLSRGALPSLSAPERHTPVKLFALSLDDEISLQLPDGYRVEELPPNVSVKSAYGVFDRKFSADGAVVHVTRQVEYSPQLVPATEYTALRKFFLGVAKADRASILLRSGA